MGTARTSYRLAWLVAVLTVLFLVWAIGALGVIGSGGRPDRMYAAVLAVALVGTVVSRLRAPGMSWTMAATAGALCVVAAVALLTGLQDTPGASTLEILGLNAMYAALFGTSAWLFHRAVVLRRTAAG